MNIKNYGIVNVPFFGFSLTVIATIFLAGCWPFSTVEKSKLVVINVLDASDFQDCHITGSINIPFDQMEERMKTLNKKDSYVLYCSNYSCTAAPFMAQTMKEDGFENVAIFHGGIVEWYQKGYPYQGPATREYLKEENEQHPEELHSDIKIVSADELKEALQREQEIK